MNNSHSNIRKLRISLFNCQSLLSKIDQIKDFLVSKNIDILCIDESWLNQKHKIQIQNYHIIRLDRTNERGEGVCIIIRENIKYQLIDLSTNEELIVLKMQDLLLNSTDFYLINYYKRPDQSEFNPQLLKKIADLGENVLLMGDFNAHSSMWFSTKENMSGKQLEQFIFANGYCLLNDHKHTYQPIYSPNYKAILDLAIASSTLMPDIISCTVSDYIFSDHYPLIIDFKLKHANGNALRIKQIKTFDTNTFYKQSVLNCCKIISYRINSIEDIDTLTELLTQAINKAYESASKTKEIKLNLNKLTCNRNQQSLLFLR